LQAGLFAAFLSAFLIFIITKLQPDSADISKNILLQISLQLSNSSVPAYVEPPFTVSSDMAAVNVLLFASLALILIDAYLAMLAKTWLRDFDRAWRSSNVLEERARAREMRLQGLERWKLAEVVALLPLLTQASLVLFGVALLVLLFNLHRPAAYVTFVILAAAFCFYVCVTVISALDTTAPFTSAVSRALQALIQRSRSSRVFSAILSFFKWRPWRTVHEDTDDEGPEAEKVEWHKVEGADIHLAISNRLYTATSKVVENLPVFTELFDQWVQTPSLHPQSMSHWRPILPLIQPYLSNAALYKDAGLRSVARLFLCSTAEEFPKGRQAVIAALRRHVKDTRESTPIEQLYFHLLHQPHSDWSLAGQVIPKLDPDMDTIMELRWILNWIPFWFRLQMGRSPNITVPGLFRTSSMRNIVSFLRITAVYIIHNQRVNDDHGIFNFLLLITRSIANASGTAVVRHPNEIFRESQTSSGRLDVGLFTSTGDFFIPPQRQWGFISDLYDASSTSAAGFRRDFTHLVILIMLNTLGTVEHSDADPEIIYNSFINLERDLPVLMDGLWETWQAPGTDHHLLNGIAVWLLKRHNGSLERPLPEQQQRVFKDLLDAYDSITSGAIPLMTPNALRFIEAALSFSLNTTKVSDTDSEWEPDTHNLENPWLVMHIHNILRRDWRIPGRAMGGDWVDQVYQVNAFDRPRQQNWDALLDWIDSTHHRIELVHDRVAAGRKPPAVRNERMRSDGPSWDEVDRLLGIETMHGQVGAGRGPPAVRNERMRSDEPSWDAVDQLLGIGGGRVEAGRRPSAVRNEWMRSDEPSWDAVDQLLETMHEQADVGRRPPAVRDEWMRSDGWSEVDRLLMEAGHRPPAVMRSDGWSEVDALLNRIEAMQHGQVDVGRRPPAVRDERMRNDAPSWDEVDRLLDGLAGGPPAMRDRDEDERMRSGGWSEVDALPNQIPSSNSFDPFDLFDLFDRERRDLLDAKERTLLEREGSRWFHRSASPTALEMIARSRLKLYEDKVLRPDPVALCLFLCQRNKEIFNDSRRLFLESLKPRSLPPPDTTEREVDLETARKLYSAVFDSKAIGDLTKWRLLAGVLFPDWEALPAEWKDLLAAEVIKVAWAEDQRGGWMARMTPLLDRKFNLYEFGLAKVDNTYGRLAPTHLNMVATVVEHLGAEGLTQQKARELDWFLQQHKSIFRDERVEVESPASTQPPQMTALNRIQTVINQVEERYAQSRNSIAQMFPNTVKTGPFHNPDADKKPDQAPADVLESLAFSLGDQT
jgi:hypothetical protein